MPTAVVPSYSVTVAPASAVPVKVGLVTLVMLSVVDTPLSEAASRSGAEGAAGATVSMVTDKAPDAALRLPAASAALAVMLWVPFASVEAAIVHVPAAATPVPITVAPSNKVTVLPASAVPVKVGVGDVGDVVGVGHAAVRGRGQIRRCRGSRCGRVQQIRLGTIVGRPELSPTIYLVKRIDGARIAKRIDGYGKLYRAVIGRVGQLDVAEHEGLARRAGVERRGAIAVYGQVVLGAGRPAPQFVAGCGIQVGVQPDRGAGTNAHRTA